MFGLLLLVCIFIVLGFILAWVAGIVAREEMEIKTGVIIMIVTAVINIALRYALALLSPGLALWLGPVVNLLVLAVMINLLGKLSWKHSFIIAAVFTALIFVLSLALASCASAV